MKEVLEIGLPGFEAKYNVEWFEDTDFSNIERVRQVYGVLFNEDGKILIINTVGNWQLPGGKPEKGESWEEALVREVLEEADVEIENILPLGYQKVNQIKENKDQPSFHQLRFAAKIKKINDSTSDPATGIVPERKFINPEEFLEYCPWGNIGKHIIFLAKKKIVGD